MNLVIIISLAILILLVSFLLFFLLKKSQKSIEDEKILDEKLESTVNKVFGMTANKIAYQSKNILQSEQDLLKTDLANKQATIEKLVKQLQEDLEQRQKEIREIEKQQIDKIGRVATAIEDHRVLTKDLKVSTEKLAKI